MSNSNLRACHSAVSPRVQFSHSDAECIACPQYPTCEQSTKNRQNGQTQRRSMSAQYTNRTAPQVKTQYNQRGPVQQVLNTGSVLAYDPTPEQDENVFTRMAYNTLSAGLGAGLQELSNSFRRTKLGVRTMEHNRKARVNRSALDRSLVELEIKEQQLAASSQERLLQQQRIKELEAELQKAKSITGPDVPQKEV